MTDRRKGHSALVWNKTSQSLKTFDPNLPAYYDGHQRPTGSNADEWHLFLSEHCCSRPNQVNGLTYMAVQIAEAIDAAARSHKGMETP